MSLLRAYQSSGGDRGAALATAGRRNELQWSSWRALYRWDLTSSDRHQQNASSITPTRARCCRIVAKSPGSRPPSRKTPDQQGFFMAVPVGFEPSRCPTGCGRFSAIATDLCRHDHGESSRITRSVAKVLPRRSMPGAIVEICEPKSSHPIRTARGPLRHSTTKGSSPDDLTIMSRAPEPDGADDNPKGPTRCPAFVRNADREAYPAMMSGFRGWRCSTVTRRGQVSTPEAGVVALARRIRGIPKRVGWLD